VISIPLLDENDQLLEADLDGEIYYIGFSWNEEAQRWTTSLRNLNRDILVSAIAVLPLWPLLRQYRTAALPPGEFVVACLPRTVLTRDSFVDGTATLFYFDEQDMAELAAT
jgi:hypothetical protein